MVNSAAVEKLEIKSRREVEEKLEELEKLREFLTDKNFVRGVERILDVQDAISWVLGYGFEKGLNNFNLSDLKELKRVLTEEEDSETIAIIDIPKTATQQKQVI